MEVVASGFISRERTRQCPCDVGVQSVLLSFPACLGLALRDSPVIFKQKSYVYAFDTCLVM